MICHLFRVNSWLREVVVSELGRFEKAELTGTDQCGTGVGLVLDRILQAD